MQENALALMMEAGPVVKAVLLVLLLFSVLSWAIIFYKQTCFMAASKQSEAFLRSVRGGSEPRALASLAKSLPASPLAHLFVAAQAEQGKGREELRRALRRHASSESARLFAYLPFLGTTGATAPFIGLFGTVWGIMDAFQGIGQTGSASLAVVAPGIAEALIATAVGLGAAIPAVMAYNYYLSRARRMSLETEDFAEELLDGAAVKGRA